MALITLNFSFPINVSAQIGDTVYVILPSRPGATPEADLLEAATTNGNILGIITDFPTDRTIVVDDTTGNIVYNLQDLANQFIMFSKDKEANTSGLLGYYMEASFECDSKKEAELFAIGSNITINSQQYE